jgi:transposase
LCRWRKRGTQNQALGRSRGGFSTKIHARTNAEGLPVALLLTPGEAHDSTAFGDLMAEHDADPAVMLADRGYDSDAIRDDVRARGGQPEIPTKKNRRVQHSVNFALYATRNRIERFFNRLKNSRRVATRYDHTASSFLGFAKLATIKQWIRFVHAT